MAPLKFLAYDASGKMIDVRSDCEQQFSSGGAQLTDSDAISVRYSTATGR